MANKITENIQTEVPPERLEQHPWAELEQAVVAGEFSGEHQRVVLFSAVSALTASNQLKILERWLVLAFKQISILELEEVILQTLLFAGFPRTIEALAVLRKLAPNSVPQKNHRRFPTRTEGEITCKRIYGTKFDRLLANMDRLHPDLTRWILEDGYGRVMSRKGLDLKTRELAVFIVLMATGMFNQFKAHWYGMLNVGWLKDDIIWLTNCFAFIIPTEIRDEFASYLVSQNEELGR